MLDGNLTDARNDTPAVKDSKPVGGAKAADQAWDRMLTKLDHIQADKQSLILNKFFTAPVYGVPFNLEFLDLDRIDVDMTNIQFYTDPNAIWAALRDAKRYKDDLETRLEAVTTTTTVSATGTVTYTVPGDGN